MTVSEILKYSVDEVLQSHRLTMAILKAYSKLYLNGRAPRGCSKSIRSYYDQFRRSNVNEKDIIMQKTNKFKRLVYTQGMHYSDANLTDELAIDFLNRGILKADDFLTLPEGWKEKSHKDILDVEKHIVKEPEAEKVPAPIKRRKSSKRK
jgi:hypothetical protein